MISCGPLFQYLLFQTTRSKYPVVRFFNILNSGPQLAFYLWSAFSIPSFPDHNLLSLCGLLFSILHIRTTTCFPSVVCFSQFSIFRPQLAFPLWSAFPIPSFPDHNLLSICGPVFQYLLFQTTRSKYPVVRFSNTFFSGPLAPNILWSGFPKNTFPDHLSLFNTL